MVSSLDQMTLAHGTARSYRIHKCRCDACKEAIRDERQRSRQRQAVHVPTFRPVEWQEKAACKGMNLDYFFGRSNAGDRDPELKLPGLAVCQSCAVVDECLQYAIQLRPEAGIFGGRTTRQRRQLLRSTASS